MKRDCLFSSSFLVNGGVCGDYYFLFYSPFPHIIHTNTNQSNTNTGGCVDWWVTINHRRVVAAALLREKGEKKKRGDQQEGRSCSVLSKMVAQIDYVGHLSGLSIRNRYDNNKKKKKEKKKKRKRKKKIERLSPK